MAGRRSSGRGLSTSESTPTVTIPKLNRDPIWSLRPWPMTVLMGGVEHQIPALCAADWLVYLMQPQPDIEGMILDFFPDSDELLYNGSLSLDGVYDTCLDLIATASARHWWIALRLISIARDSWHVLGPEMLRKVDVERLSLAGWLDVLTVTIINSMDPKETMLFTLRLESPPIEVETGPEEMEMTQESFLSLMR